MMRRNPAETFLITIAVSIAVFANLMDNSGRFYSSLYWAAITPLIFMVTVSIINRYKKRLRRFRKIKWLKKEFKAQPEYTCTVVSRVTEILEEANADFKTIDRVQVELDKITEINAELREVAFNN